LPRISNFDDLDPFKLEPGVELVMVPPGQPIPVEAGLIIVPGSKATIADMHAMRAQGWDIDIRAHHRRGGAVLGICGGYQMLGRRIIDADGLEGPPGETDGLGLLDVETILSAGKALERVNGTALGAAFTGYEMHIGVTAGPDCDRPFAMLAGERSDGASSRDGKVLGTYIHGPFTSTTLRDALLRRLGSQSVMQDYDRSVEDALDEIAVLLEQHVDIDAIIALALG
ncbi:MAG: cobyric acid synthase CobQ, partial [bacterium]|nr:cobyric acid synthase CobQ [bacterium]